MSAIAATASSSARTMVDRLRIDKKKVPATAMKARTRQSRNAGTTQRGSIRSSRSASTYTAPRFHKSTPGHWKDVSARPGSIDLPRHAGSQLSRRGTGRACRTM